ncbi:glycosyl hydrolase family 18 protein [Pullulanibacillus sp. KACC 23026]|uniref:glycosyl hydrolase family 18 protein n=1 Tax=Pullulanibacillus sp. KACC 23026 TaxID=3028315 RepID=UPI0023AF9A16|nr:glycosyl hydrolase family 18 protein [Pullulanibacillus sp. KACC 23026]WEG10971.1 glycosyl hydrolase family 18 protein [Pullulanibacillus sp. KACC 23026]
MNNLPLIFEHFFKRLFIMILILAIGIVGLPTMVILSQPQNFKNAMYTLSHPNALKSSVHLSNQSINPKTQNKASSNKTSDQLLAMGWLTGENAQLTTYQELKTVSPLFATIGADTQIHMDLSASSIKTLHDEGKKVWGRVTLSTQSDATTQHFLENTGKMTPLIHGLIARALQTKLDGINLDIEQIPAVDRSAYSQFVEKLSKATKQTHLTLSIDLQPEDSTIPHLATYNQQLGKDSDYIIYMGYDQHWSTDAKPGPVTSLEWLEDNIKQFINTGIPPQKLVLGLPSYSRIWQVDKNGETISSSALSNEYINTLMQEEHNKETWNPQLADYYTSYNKNGKHYEVWLSNNRSLLAYLELINKYHLGGVGFWNLNMISSNDWNQLMKQFNSTHKSTF